MEDGMTEMAKHRQFKLAKKIIKSAKHNRIYQTEELT